MSWLVEIKFLFGGWEDCWTETGADDVDRPLRFSTRWLAEDAVEEFVRDTHEEFLKGNLSSPYLRSDCRVRYEEPQMELRL